MNEAAKLFWENRPTQAMQALHDLMTERHRQMMVEGWTAKHDDEHGCGAMAVAAACYALASEPPMQLAKVDFTELWGWTGWAMQWWKPKDKRRNLIRAAALLLAEIERMDRAASRGVTGAPAAPFTCWGLSSFCAEVGHKCRAAGVCVYAPPTTGVSESGHQVNPPQGRGGE